MKTLFYLLTIVMFCGTVTNLNAHALFIKTETKAQAGKDHQVIIYYAEAEDGKKEKIADWWSNTTDFKLWLHLPDGSKKQLKTQAQQDHFTARFTPEIEGSYLLEIQHDVAAIFDETQYQFNTSALVEVGKSHKKSDQTLTSGFRIIPLHTDTKGLMRFKIYSDQTSIADLPVTIFAPDGWKKTIQSDKQGVFEFNISEKGEYLIETYKVIDVDEEEFNKKSLIVTTLLDCN